MGPLLDSSVMVVHANGSLPLWCYLMDVRSASPRWTPAASPEHSRLSQTVVSLSEHEVAMLGGQYPHDVVPGSPNSDTVQVYDVRANRWSVRDQWRLPEAGPMRGAVLLP